MKKLKSIAFHLLLISLLSGFSSAHAALAIIAHPDNSLETISAKDVTRIFLGKTKSFPGGGSVKAIDQAIGNPARNQFYTNVIRKDESKLKRYWSKLMFSGKGQPPRLLPSDSAIKAYVSKTPNAIGYIDKKAVDRTVKILLIVP